MEALPQIPLFLKVFAFVMVGLYGLYEFRRNGKRVLLEFGLMWFGLGIALLLM